MNKTSVGMLTAASANKAITLIVDAEVQREIIVDIPANLLARKLFFCVRQFLVVPFLFSPFL